MPKTYRLTVKAGEHVRVRCPVTCDVPWAYEDFPAAVLTDKATGARIPCQIEKSGNMARMTWLSDGLKAGSEQRLVVTPSRKDAGAPVVSVVPAEEGAHVGVFVGGKPFTAYHYGPEWVRPFLYPVIGPYGKCVTRNWPMQDVPGEHQDHPHHKSVWVAYGDCNGVDNWSEDGDHGYQRHKSFSSLVSGPVFGEVVAENDWTNHKGRKQFEETRAMRFYALPDGARLFDLVVTFRMTEGKMVFRDTKEGGLVAVRVASSMDVRNGGRIENGYGGINETETWGKKAPWCDYSGVVGGKRVGLALLDHETNPRYPTEWHVRDYGLMTANCFAWHDYRPTAGLNGDMVFEKGSSRTWRYRLYVHRGDARTGDVAGRFHDFMYPPCVNWE